MQLPSEAALMPRSAGEPHCRCGGAQVDKLLLQTELTIATMGLQQPLGADYVRVGPPPF